VTVAPVVLGALVAFGAPWASASAPAAAPDPCASTAAAHLSVRASEHRLYLCEGGKAMRSFGVRLAKDGLGKTRDGDGKLPVGAYPLGRPRPSKQYGTFIPIGYPTPEQRRRGYTGGSVGVHGPDRRVRWLGDLVNTFDSTDGCVGLATDDEMDQIATWVRRVRAERIVIDDAT
jgi:murein L,D-transpeptidase YafK